MENVKPDLNKEIKLLLEEFSPPEDTIPPKPRSRKRSKLWLALISFACFLAVIYFSHLNLLNAAIFCSVLLFHEAGHIVAMRLLGYSNPAVLFIPFLGALAFTEKKQASLTDKVLVNLAGPLPGLAIGIPLWLWLHSQGVLDTSDWRLTLAAILIGLNLFNLLPIYPLDGGQVANDLLFSRFNFSLLIFQWSGFLILVTWGILIQNFLFILFALLIIPTTSWESKKCRVKQKLHRKRIYRGRMELKYFLEALLSTIQETFPKQSQVERLVLARLIINDCRDTEASKLSRFALMFLYALGLFGTFFVLFSVEPVSVNQITPRILLLFKTIGSRLTDIVVENSSIIIGLCLLLLLTTVLAPHSNKKLPKSIQAWLALRKNDLDLIFMKILMVLGQETTAIRQARAWLFHKKGNFEKAIAELNKAIEIDPYNPDAYEQRHLLYKNKAFKIEDLNHPERHRSFDSAIEAVDTLIKLRSRKKEYYCDRSELKYFVGEYDSALEDCNYFVSNSPDSPRGYQIRGWIHEKLGNYDSALQDFDRFMALDRENDNSYYSRSHLLAMSLERYEEALADINRSLALNSSFSNSYWLRGRIHEKLGDYTSSLQDFDKHIALNPEDSNSYYWRANLLAMSLERYEEALADINRSLELDPSDRNRYWLRSRIWENLGESEKAAADLKIYNDLNSASN